jgi:hypothetical protein
MTSYLRAHGIRIFDYTRFAEPLREQIRQNAGRLAKQTGIEIQFLRKGNIRKETVAQGILAKRGNQPGLVCILSAMETCPSYKPWHDERSCQPSAISHQPSASRCRRLTASALTAET